MYKETQNESFLPVSAIVAPQKHSPIVGTRQKDTKCVDENLTDLLVR